MPLSPESSLVWERRALAFGAAEHELSVLFRGS